MAVHFVFPRDSTEPTRPEEMFAEQWAALTEVGFTASLCSDAVLTGIRPLRDIRPGELVVYRGWMVKVEEYAALVRAIANCGAIAFTSPQEYAATHYLPNWYPLLSDMTPETRIYPENADIVAEMGTLSWGGYFLKDYVKSLKTGRGSIVHDPDDVPAVIQEMREYRGEIEGGICVRRLEEYRPNTERRYFVLNGIAHAADSTTPPEIVCKCAMRIPSKFFTIDVAKRKDEVLRIIEVGDGQVSDLVGWSPRAFADMWVNDGRS